MRKPKTETFITTETKIQCVTTCSECSELLTHSIYRNPNNSNLVELSVERCPDCTASAKKVIEDLLGCPDLNWDDLEKETIKRISKARKWLIANGDKKDNKRL